MERKPGLPEIINKAKAPKMKPPLDKQMKDYLYTISAYDGLYYCQVNLIVKANGENNALELAKSLVKRETYAIKNVEEIK